jgi:hypothetical protein
MRKTKIKTTENKTPVRVNIMDGSRIIWKLERRSSSKLDPTMFTRGVSVTDIMDMVRQM